MKKISFNLGFVTNSSSAIFHFPNFLLKDPRVISFIEKFEIEGFVGENMWSREACSTIALTKEQKIQAKINIRACSTIALTKEQKIQAKINIRSEYGEPKINIDSNEFVVIYGDESTSLASYFASFLSDICNETKVAFERNQYN